MPIVLLWGEDGVMIYNDAYSVFAGGRHPQLLGSKVREGWPEVADFNDNVMKVGLSGGTLAYKDQELTLYRHGRPEQVWMNLDYSPVLNEAGQPAGVIAIVVETTQRVIAERSLKDRENDLARVQKIARVGGVSVDLRNGFDNGRRSPEYLEIHGLSPDVVDTHEDWVSATSSRRPRADRAALSAPRSTAPMRAIRRNTGSSGRTTDKCGGSPARRRSSGTKRASRCG